jgi:hypothetical protein
MPYINPLHASANSKKLSCMDCQSPTPTSQNLPELWISIFQEIDELVCLTLLQKSELAVLVLGLEKLRLGLDNHGRTSKRRLLSRL